MEARSSRAPPPILPEPQINALWAWMMQASDQAVTITSMILFVIACGVCAYFGFFGASDVVERA